MFAQSRLVVVDDKDEHLAAIKETLNQLRMDCHSKRYDEEAVAEWTPLPGIRILFLDQNLISGATIATDQKIAFSAIEDVLQKLICPDSGPYGLVLWAEQPDVDALRTQLYERFTDDDARLLPVFFTALRKADYIDTTTGATLDPERLRKDIRDRMSESPQMKALFSWETDVAVASDAVLRSMLDLVPAEVRASPEFEDELGKVLYRISQAGAGIERAEEQPREAINRVLVPILADRITEHDPSGDANDAWASAIVAPENPKGPAPVSVQAKVNRAIHLSFAKTAGSEPIRPTELGAVVSLPGKTTEDILNEHFGLSLATLRASLFKANELELADCRARLVQIGAACDAAQPKPGPLLYLFALECPFAHADGEKIANDPKPRLSVKGKRADKKDIEWQSPVLALDGADFGGWISVFKNLTLSVEPGKTADWNALYRLREELVSQLTQDYARHISRPGIVSL